MKFRAHDTFFIRKGWLNKGMRNVKIDPAVFMGAKGNPMDILGIGANMVKALRYWLQAVNLTTEPNAGKREQSFTPFGEVVFKNDPYIEEMGTLWFLHYMLASNKDEATAWYFFYNEFKQSEFNKEDFVKQLSNYIMINGEEVSERSLEDDYNCIINTYVPRIKSSPEKVQPESNIDCPLGELGLIDISNRKEKLYKKSVPKKDTIHPLVLLAVILDRAKGEEEIKISTIQNDVCNAGKIFNLDIISPFEHNAVTRVLYHLQTMYDIKVETLSFDKDTMTYDMARIRNQFAEKKPNWMVVSHASNICGVVSPIKELCRLSKEFGAINVIDMCQTAGLVDTDLSGEDIDFAVFAGHKTLYSPLGVAGVVSSFAIKPQPLLFGGTGVESANQALPETVPERYEVASPDIAAFAGLNASLKWIKETGIENIYAKEQENHKRLIELLSKYENIKVLEMGDAETIGVVSCLFDGYGSDSIGQVLSEQNIAVRTGLHCAPIAHKFLGTFPAGTVRFSVSYFNTSEEFEMLENALDYIEANS